MDALDQHAIVSIADANGTIVFVNNRFCEISGFTEVELIGQDHRILKSGMHDAEFYQNLWSTVGEGKIWHREICNRTKSGSLYWVATTIIPDLGDDGLPAYYTSIHTDITAQKMAGKPNSLNREVEKGAIAGAKPVPKFFSLQDLVNDVVNKHRATAAAKRFQLTMDVGNGFPAQYRGDARRLGQVLTLLLDNAIEFASTDIVRVQVIAGEQRALRHEVLLIVSDTDVGTSPECLDRVFNPPPQTESGAMRHVSGNGVDLNPVKNIVEQLKGSVRVNNEINAGNTFACRLWLDVEAPTDTTRFEQNENPYELTRSIHGALVLVTEDNLINQKVLAAMLRKMGLQVEIANNGREALTRLRRLPCPDLILMDLQMPEMDGTEATIAIRAGLAGEAAKHLPIVAVSASLVQRDYERAIHAGMSGSMTKPVNPNELAGNLLRWIAPRANPLSGGAQMPHPIHEATTTKTPATTTWPTRIGGVELGILSARMGQNFEVIPSVLRRFAAVFSDFQDQVRTAQGENDIAALKHLFHTLKGASGNVAATYTSAMAAQVDQALASSADNLPVLIDISLAALAADLEAIGSSPLLQEPPASADPITPEMVVPMSAEEHTEAALLVEDLAHALNRQKIIKPEMLGRLRSTFAARVNPELLHALEQSIGRFDYKSATLALQSFREEVGF